MVSETLLLKPTCTDYNNISPKSVEEIQGILKIANQYSVPLWVCSQGKNFG